MSYTTVDTVAQSFLTFVRNGPKGPSDTLIQKFIDDEAGEIDAILQRRFQEAITGPPALGNFAVWVANFSPDQLNLLEKINRLGACGALGKVFAAAGVTLFAKLAADYEKEAQDLLNRLNARDEHHKPVPQGGDYDYLFDSSAKVETPRPQLGGIAGGDQQPGQNASENSSNVFKKWDRREF
jgi:hypothetical protein